MDHGRKFVQNLSDASYKNSYMFFIIITITVLRNMYNQLRSILHVTKYIFTQLVIISI